MNKYSFQIFIAATLITTSVVVRAGENTETLDQKLTTIKFEKLQAEIMIKKMKARGRLDEEEASMAKRAIASVKEEDIEQIRVEALETLKSANTFATK
jgi:hypothetical protein